MARDTVPVMRAILCAVLVLASCDETGPQVYQLPERHVPDEMGAAEFAKGLSAGFRVKMDGANSVTIESGKCGAMRHDALDTVPNGVTFRCKNMAGDLVWTATRAGGAL